MLIHYGFHIELEICQTTTIVTTMDVHPSRRADIVNESELRSNQEIRSGTFADRFGNLSRRLTVSEGQLSLDLRGIVRDCGRHDETNLSAVQVDVSRLPIETLPLLRASRYCESDLLSDLAWSRFGGIIGGWARVQAICDFVNSELTFSYPNARPTRTAFEALQERSGVCRDFTHLAVALCRCLNIPARYCNGYLGDIGVPTDPAPMDFNAWFEAFLGSRWYTFDARHNIPRIGRVLIARGRDAADVPMITSFGPHALTRFEVLTHEIQEEGIFLAA
jgi:transglutaminase-like putative cysteine protease